MNKRILELSKQCYETGSIGKDGWPEYSKFNEIKFAELIVRECAEVADNADVMRQKWEGIGKYVREHFGVEEC